MDNSTLTEYLTSRKCAVHFNEVNFTGPRNRSSVPKLYEWEQLWCGWDVVSNMINHETMLFEQPIGLRHPFIFYIGHIPAFLDVQITRHKVDSVTNENYPLTEPATFADIFERGIDPDMDNPNICNPHSCVPSDKNDWPSVKSILQYQQLVRNRLKRLLLHWENSATSGENVTAFRQSAGHVVWMCFEHEAMHLETLLYMIVQSPNFTHPPVSPPSWYKHRDQCSEKVLPILDSAKMISFSGGNVDIGTDEIEEANMDCLEPQSKINFGWDNEHPKRVVAVLPFELQSRPVTNGEYWLFWKDTDHNQLYLPAAWHMDSKLDNNQLPKVKTSFGLCEFDTALNWPVQVSCQQAEAYASKNGMRLPTEPEWIHFRRTMEHQLTTADQRRNDDIFLNYGFKSWTPHPLNNEVVHLLGGVWEWTSTVFGCHGGFVSSQLYPGYSSDFFDGKHRVVLGASWATHPRIAERVTFRNWYQWRYPYVFCGFRLCRSLNGTKKIVI